MTRFRLEPAPAIILALVCCLPCLSQKLSIENNQIPGIQVIGSNSLEFDSLLQQIVPQANDRTVLAPVLPYSFIVRNTDSRGIQIITARFAYVSAATHTPAAGTLLQHYGEGGLASGGIDLFTPSGSLSLFRETHSPYQSALKYLKEIGGSPTVTGSVDSLVYADGEFQGPDRSRVFQFLQWENAGSRALTQEIQAMQDQPDDAVRKRLTEISSEARERIGTLLVSQRWAGARALLRALDHGGRQGMQAMMASMITHPPAIAVWKGQQ